MKKVKDNSIIMNEIKKKKRIFNQYITILTIAILLKKYEFVEVVTLYPVSEFSFAKQFKTQQLLLFAKAKPSPSLSETLLKALQESKIILFDPDAIKAVLIRYV